MLPLQGVITSITRQRVILFIHTRMRPIQIMAARQGVRVLERADEQHHLKIMLIGADMLY